MANVKDYRRLTVDLSVDELQSIDGAIRMEDWSRVGIQAVKHDDGGTWATGVITLEKSNDGRNWESAGTITGEGFQTEVDVRVIGYLNARTTTAEAGGSRVDLHIVGWRETP